MAIDRILKIKRKSYLKLHPPKSSRFKPETRKEWDKTATGKGYYWEKEIAYLLMAKHVNRNRMSRHYDLEWEGKKIDVKSCNLYKRKTKRGKPISSPQSGWWVFNKNKLNDADYYICVCLINNKVEKIYMIPSLEFPKKGITIGQKSRFEKFIFFRWDK